MNPEGIICKTLSQFKKITRKSIGEFGLLGCVLGIIKLTTDLIKLETFCYFRQ